jgi:electron transfer flavoprotein beta subunit
MRILVLLEVGADVCISPDLDPRCGRVREEWLVRELDGASARALDLALKLESLGVGVVVTAVHLGPSQTEPWLRQALARRADAAVRVWSEELAGVTAPGKALVLAAAARAAGFDIVLAGAAGVRHASAQLGVLLAEHLGVPCVTQAVELALAQGGGDSLEVVRGLDRGFRERVAAPLPAVVTVTARVSGAVDAPPQPSASARLRAQSLEIPVWDLADLGVPLVQVRRAGEALRTGPARPARPRLRAIAAPDSSLAAFDRILGLVEGSVKRREGRVVRQTAEQTVEQIFDALRTEGWLDHLRPGAAGADGASLETPADT